MASDITRQGGGGPSSLSLQGVRRLRRAEEELAIQTQLANETDIAQGLLANASIQRFSRVARSARAAIDEDPLNVGVLGILEALAEGAQARVRSVNRW